MSKSRAARRHACSWVLGWAVAAGFAVCATPQTAHAQTAPLPAMNGAGFDLRLFRPAVDSKGHFTVNGTDILGHLDFAIGLVVDWGRDLGRVGSQTMGTETDRALIENMFTGTFLANLGLANWLMIGLQLPVHLTYGPGGSVGLDPSRYAAPAGGLAYQGFGDAALNVKFRFLRSERTHFGIAAILQGAVGIPAFGDPSRSFSGEPGLFSLWPQLAFEWRPSNLFRLDLNVGYRHFFGAPSTLENPADQTNTRLTYGQPLTAGIGFAVRPVPALEIVAETYAAQYTNGFGNLRALPWEALGGLKVFVQRNSYLTIGAGTRIPVANAPAAANFRAFLGIVFEPSIGDTDGDGYRDDVDRCPTRPEDFDHFEDSDGCPEPDNDQDGILDVEDNCPLVAEDRDGEHDGDGCPESEDRDSDGDGILDRLDRCANEPEDRDEFEDTDGCPDPDNDHDGILDTQDACRNVPEDIDQFEDTDGCPDPDNDRDRIPDERDRCRNEPEVYNGEQDEDGCPDEGEVVLEDTQIRILHSINFETGSARIRQDSISVVEAVARTLQHVPQIRLMEVQGHTDERGDDEQNLRLSRDRAAAVVDALVQRGIDRARLHSAGYGERCRAGYPAQAGRPPLNSVCQGTRRPPRWCHSDRAWRNDRRVVFLILATDQGPARVRVACDEAVDLIPQEDRQYHNPQ